MDCWLFHLCCCCCCLSSSNFFSSFLFQRVSGWFGFFLSILLRFWMRNVVCVHYIKIDGDVAEKASWLCDKKKRKEKEISSAAVALYVCRRMYMWWLRAIIITSATSCALKERNKERECNRLDTAIVIVVVNKCRRKLLRSSSNPTLVVGETIEGKKEKKIRPKIPNVRTRNYMLYTLQLSRLGILLFNVVTTTL